MEFMILNEQQQITHRVKTVYKFIMALYSTKIKEQKTLKRKIVEFKRNFTAVGKVKKALTKAEKVAQAVAETVRPDHVVPLSHGEASTFKAVLTEFAMDITTLTSMRPLQIGKRSTKFIRDWNELARTFDGQFLHGYGVIHPLDISVNDNHVLVGVLDMLGGRIPKELSLYLTSDILNVVQTQIRLQDAQTRRVEVLKVQRARRMQVRITAAFQNN